jgi:hypothetical protein
VTHPATESRELAHRAHDSLEVTLSWHPRSNEISVEVVDDRLEQSFTLTVDPGSALDAFHHPYAYAPAWIGLDTGFARETAAAEASVADQ